MIPMKQHFLTLLLISIILAGCTAGLSGKPLAEPLNNLIVNKCADISCGSNAFCKDGACYCSNGFKTCKNEVPSTTNSCVPGTGCCTEKDCKNNEVCVSGTCTFTCDKITCESNKICYEKNKGCYCPNGYKWCDNQERCIPSNVCCGKYDCARNQICTKTIDSTYICLTGDQRTCRYVSTTPKDLTLQNTTVTIAGKQFHYGQYVTLLVDGDEHNLTAGDNVSIKGLTLNVAIIKNINGVCQDTNADNPQD
jgi:hypothetical protein